MKWATWRNVGIDRMGCAWLIRRFIDPKAKFVFIPQGSAPLPDGTEPFDLPGVRLSHKRGHCTFHTMLGAYKLRDPVLKRIARIIDEADTVQEASVEAAAPGIDLICRGIRLTSKDDYEAIKRGYRLYEALYAVLSAERP
jgi:hypothetical protein